MENKEQKLAEISKDVSELKKSMTVVINITSKEMLEQASAFLTKIMARKKRIEELRVSFVKPLNDQVSFINKQFKEPLNELLAIENDIKAGIIRYRSAEAKRIATQNVKREEKGKELVEQKKEINTDEGKIQVRKIWTFDIENENDIPREYLSVDSVKIRQAISGGVRDIKGIKIYQKESLSSYGV